MDQLKETSSFIEERSTATYHVYWRVRCADGNYWAQVTKNEVARATTTVVVEKIIDFTHQRLHSVCIQSIVDDNNNRLLVKTNSHKIV